MSDHRGLWEDCDMRPFTCDLTPAEIAAQLGARLTASHHLVMRRGLFHGVIVGEAYTTGQGKTTLRLDPKHTDLVAKAERLFAR